MFGALIRSARFISYGLLRLLYFKSIRTGTNVTFYLLGSSYVLGLGCCY